MYAVLTCIAFCALIFNLGSVEGAALCSNLQADVHFLIDSSGSVGSANFNKMKTFIAQFASSFTIGPNNVQMGASIFSSKIHPVFQMNQYKTKTLLVDAITAIKYMSGGTNTGDAINWVDHNAFTHSSGGRDGVSDILIVLTDGKSNNAANTANAASTLHQHGVKTFIIGIGNGVAMPELENIATDHHHVLTTPSFDTLHSLQTRLQEDACNAAIGTTIGVINASMTTATGPLDFCASSPCQNNARCLDDSVGYFCMCDGGFTGKNCETDICSIHPCQNNGRCLEDARGFVCLCGKGFTGTTCETAITWTGTAIGK